MNYDVAVVGGGPAGLAAAARAAELGHRVLLVEWEEEPGGLPRRLARLGIHTEAAQLAERLAAQAERSGVEVLTGAYAHSADPEGGRLVLNLVMPRGLLRPAARAVIYAGGARERHPFELGIAGHRPAGVHTALEAVAMAAEGLPLGRRAVVVGAGDLGLLAARRLAQAGLEVTAVDPHPPPEPPPVPVLTGFRAAAIRGSRRAEAVVAVRDGDRLELPCDVVVVAGGRRPNAEWLERSGASVGPEGPLADGNMATTVPGLFVAGDALIPSSAEQAAEQGRLAAEAAHLYLAGVLPPAGPRAAAGPGVRRVAPESPAGGSALYVRVERPASALRVPELGLEARGRFHPGRTAVLRLPPGAAAGVTVEAVG